MEYSNLKDRAIYISNLYDSLNAKSGQKVWEIQDVMAGFVGDVGDLSELIMAKNGLRHKPDLDNALSHELSDCLWSILVLAEKLNINLESEFTATMNKLEQKIKAKLN